MIPLLTLLLVLTPSQARKRPLGSTLHLEGHVTVASGLFSSFMNDNGFVLGDANNGIYVTTQNPGYRSVGSLVEVHGTLADNGHGLLVLRALDIRPQRGHRLISPWKIEREVIDEFYEGKLVQTEGEVIRLENDLPAGHKLFLRRGAGPELQVFIPPAVKLDTALLTPGRLLKVTGFCAQYDRIYEIVVRSAKDFKPR